MAHWLLRERMAEHNEDRRAIKDDQHRPEQNNGDDEAARGRTGERKGKTEERPPSND